MATELSASPTNVGPPPSSPPLFQFFLLAFALMWVCFFTVALVPISAASALGQLLLVLGAFGPAVAALAVTVRGEGWSGASAFLRRCFRPRVAVRWCLFA